MSRRRAGFIALAVLMLLTYLTFTKDIPFTHGHRLNVYFMNANNVKVKAPVRIAGVNVGKVVAIERDKGSPNVKLVLDLKDTALPVHADATAKVRPRIFLEGNGFIDLRPGSPSSPVLDSGGSIPAAQTSNATQLDQLLTAVNSDARDGLESIFTEIGTALNTVGTPEENKTQEPEVAKLTGGQALNRAMRYGPEGFKGGARVFDALIGFGEDDQTDILNGFRDFNKAINDRESQVGPLITDFATMMGAFAADERALQEATREFSRVTYESEPTLRELNEMLPRVTTFANELAPHMDELPAMVDAAEPWIEEMTALLAENEMGTTARLSRSAVRNFAKASNESLKAFPEFNRLAVCWSNVWYPSMVAQVPDGATSSGVESYKEFWYALAGMAGESQNFNANGPYFRLGAGSGAEITQQGKAGSQLFGPAARAQTGVRPALPAKNPELRSDVPCYKNTPANLAATSGSTP